MNALVNDPPSSVIDPAELRRCLGSFVTGVTVITVTPVTKEPRQRRSSIGSISVAAALSAGVARAVVMVSS